MKNLLIRRLLLAIPILFGVSVLSFLLLHLIPGDPARIIAGIGAAPEDVEVIRKEFHLDAPLYIQYISFITGLFNGNLKSINTQDAVIKEIVPRFINTFQLSLFSIVISSLIGITFGIIAAIKRNTWIDNLVMGFSLFGISMPIFWLGILLMLVFSLYLNILPPGGKGGFQHIILPGFTLGIASAAIVARMTRASMLQVLNQDYIRTALSTGLPKSKVIVKYALKNALIPVVTIVGLQFGYMLGGAVLTESVFGWPGLGRLIVDSIFNRDYPVVQAGILLIAVVFVLVNLGVDLLYAVLDPRIRRR